MQKILNLIDNPIIAQRGIKYYNQGRVFKFNLDEEGISALVVGSREAPYNVSIRFDPSENSYSFYCSCPYAADYVECKHIAAVLLHYERVKKEYYRPAENPILKEKNKFKDDFVLDLSTTKDAEAKDLDYIPELGGITGLGGKNTEKRFFLVFVIENCFDYNSDYNNYAWHIYPALRYLKKNGQPGRFTKFKSEKLSESCRESESRLLEKLMDMPSGKSRFINHVDYLLENNVTNVYLKNSSGEYAPAVFENIQKVEVKFRLSRSGNDTVFFKPVIYIPGKNSDYPADRIDNWRRNITKSGFDFFIFSPEGRIYWKKNSGAFYSLFKILNELNERFSYHAINKIDQYFKGCSEIDISFKTESIRYKSLVPEPFIEISEEGRGPEASLDIVLFFDYSGRDVPLDSTYAHYILSDEGSEILVAERNEEYEKKIYGFLRRKFSFIEEDIYGRQLYAHMPLVEFLSEYGKEIIDEGIKIRLRGNRKKISDRGGKVSISVSSNINWLDLNADYINEYGEKEEIDLDKSLLDKGLLRTGDSYTIISKEYIDKLKILSEEQKQKNGKYRISKYNFHIINELYENIENKESDKIKNLREISEKLRNFNKIEQYSLPDKFKGKLRHYQKAGYNWLHFLNMHSLNGCLADDMGLGKTVQTLALMQKLKEEKRLRTSLIVVPVSAVSNWEIEIQKFTPSLNYHVHLGQKRKKCIKHLNKHDIVLVSYSTLRNDIELFNKSDYSYVILDESQNIKNHRSLTFKAIRTLKSDFRLSLTGTPVENNTLELWSQMDFLNPGLLGSAGYFKKHFAAPIEKYRDKEKAQKLKEIIFPFILRRKKSDVLRDLPKKSEIIIYSEMDEKQKLLYDRYKEFYRSQVMGKIKKEGVAKSSFEIFTALLKLRQVALFPSLADKKNKNIPSCKFEQLKEMLSESIEEGHKILLFSQFVESLKIIRNFAEREKYSYSYIDGSVSSEKRRKEIKSFQEDKEIKLFLLSLKAGGTAINLNAADYVIMFDPWWNPAVESQAVDRAHRIGQRRKVIAYKMIVKNTVEEKILELQKRKKELVEDVVTADSSFYKALTGDDIKHLFN
ncbi:MAG: SNF2-related protein [Elusimicrobiota bacterium]